MFYEPVIIPNLVTAHTFRDFIFVYYVGLDTRAAYFELTFSIDTGYRLTRHGVEGFAADFAVGHFGVGGSWLVVFC